MKKPSLSGAPDPDKSERPIEDPNNAAPYKIKQGGDARPQIVEKAVAGGAGSGGHRLEVRPRRLLDEVVSDADIRPDLNERRRTRPWRIDGGGRKKVLQRCVAVRCRLHRQQFQIVGGRRCRGGGVLIGEEINQDRRNLDIGGGDGVPATEEGVIARLRLPRYDVVHRGRFVLWFTNLCVCVCVAAVCGFMEENLVGFFILILVFYFILFF